MTKREAARILLKMSEEYEHLTKRACKRNAELLYICMLMDKEEACRIAAQELLSK